MNRWYIAFVPATFGIDLDDALVVDRIPVQVQRAVVNTARQWPLYFCRYFPVVEDRAGSEYVAEMLSIGETGIRLLARDYQSQDHPLAVLDHFE